MNPVDRRVGLVELVAEVTAIWKLREGSYENLPSLEALVARLQSWTIVFIHLVEYIACTGSLQPSPSPRPPRRFPRHAHPRRVKAPPDRREIFAAVATATISPKFRVDCGKEIRVVIHTNATVSW
jgi:hypothetical protein